jgi:NitT/TauT family transport system ATP-binding protein
VSEKSILEVQGVSKRLTSASGEEALINDDIHMSVGRGEFVSVVGPSGAGKTTLLRTLSGLLEPDAGRISHGGEPVAGVPSWLSIVFQEYNKSLFPWLSVRRNVALAVRQMAGAERGEAVKRALDQVGLLDFADRYPWELSGGMQQRVALARAMVCRPQLILMDEPFASVDALTRAKLEDMVLALWDQGGFAALLVTHDIGEAVYLSDRVLALSARPSTILAEVEVDLPRPRTQATTRGLPRFHELNTEILGLVEDAGTPAAAAVL